MVTASNLPAFHSTGPPEGGGGGRQEWTARRTEEGGLHSARNRNEEEDPACPGCSPPRWAYRVTTPTPRHPKRSATSTPCGSATAKEAVRPPSCDRHGHRRDARYAWLGRPQGGRARPPRRGGTAEFFALCQSADLILGAFWVQMKRFANQKRAK